MLRSKSGEVYDRETLWYHTLMHTPKMVNTTNIEIVCLGQLQYSTKEKNTRRLIDELQPVGRETSTSLAYVKRIV